MLRNNIAGTLSSIGLGAVQKANVVGEDKDLGQAIAKGINDWGDFGRKKALVDAMQSGDMDQVNKAYAAYDPEAYAKQMFANEQSKQEREWQLSDNETEFNRKKQLAAIKFANDMELEKEKRKNGTTAQQNMSYLQSLGYTPEEAASLYYSGQNPNMNVAMLGQKGFEAYDKETGKGLAERVQQAKEAEDEFKTVSSNIDRIKELLPQANVDTFIDRKTPTMFFSPSAQEARGELRNLLGGMRLDHMKYMKGAISDKEQEFLNDVVSGNFSNYTPAEITGAMNSIKRKAEAIRSQYNKTQPTNWGEVSDDDLLKGL